MKNKKENIRIIKFTLFSLSAGVIEFLTYSLLDRFTSFSYWVCYVIALIASIIWNFTLNREYTFKSASNVHLAMTKVVLFYLLFTPTSTLLGSFLSDSLKWNGHIVTLLMMLLNFILEYVYDRYYVFKDSLDTKK